MKLVVWILIILFVNKLSVHAAAILENINLSVENETSSSAPSVTSNTETLTQFNVQKGSSILVNNFSDLEEMPQPSQNLNSSQGDSSSQPAERGREESTTVQSLVDVEVSSNSYLEQEKDFEHVAIQHEAEINLSDNSGLKTTQNRSRESDGSFMVSESHNLVSIKTLDLPKQQKEKADPDHTNSETLRAFPVLAGTQSDTTDKHQLASLSLNVTQDLLVSQVHINKSETEEHKLNNSNQTWTANRVQTLNQYIIATTPFNSQGVSQSSNVVESELIEIILKDATYLDNKTKDENNISSELAVKSFKVPLFNMTEGDVAKKALEERPSLNSERDENVSILLASAGPTSNRKLEIVPLKSFQTQSTIDDSEFNKQALQELINLSERPEVNVVTTTPSAILVKESKLVNIIDKDLEILDVGGVTSKNTILEESSFKSEPTLINNDEQSPGTSNSLKKTPPTFNEPANELGEVALKEVPKLNQTQENNLIPLESLATHELTPVAANELGLSTLNSFKEHQNFSETKNSVDHEVLKEVLTLNEKQEDPHINSLERLDTRNTTFFDTNAKTSTSFRTLKRLQNVTEVENEGKLEDLQEIAYFNEKPNENDFNPIKAFSSSIQAAVVSSNPLNCSKGRHDCMVKADELNKEALEAITTLSKQESTQKSLFISEKPQNFSKMEKALGKVTGLSDKVTALGSIESLVELDTSPSSNIDPLNEFEEPKTERNSSMFENQQLLERKQYSTEYSTFSLEEEEEEEEKEMIFKPKISLEEYAVKQMDFVLDHLLLETQKFVATVLQATINSVFPRDRLKQYAEGVTQVLNPAVEAADYSDEILESTKPDGQEEIYEKIMEKLNFLRSKPSKYLQKQIPPEWLNEFQDKRAEFVIWLDKAAEQMHKEFIGYITEEQDPIKYQYFNETFDDISRATEIHHKLALLADLVKIIKNKKQITFTDLYMQT